MEQSIQVASFIEEITGWTRRIYFDFEGKRCYVSLYYNEGDGYEAGTPDFGGENDIGGEWTDEERTALFVWLRDYENLALLDDLTSGTN
jgi:hypothetical protein